ncbi:hypothetical protein IU449_07650 [Nocardia higoensis]|uniref:DUF8176 domain-containing protein n=1 Tax=Nocardia higoensis TaxID=228599 RepID=A0ABS0D7Q3_9NOCA|nr:hypothetical protein [Nocardia higoensis]MBF6354416.1 hypothetical protein [Nocardia higoensis]
MLKSYKDLSRWYGPIEPEGTPASTAVESAAVPEADRDRPASTGPQKPVRSPDHVREEGPDADPADARAVAEVPADLPTRRAEFTGGWSDWVAEDAPVPVHAPGPDDDFPERGADLVRFPWPDDDDEYDEDPAPTPPATRSLREHPATRRARTVIILVVAILVLIASAVGALVLVRLSGDRPAAAPDPAPMRFTAGSAQAGITTGCPTERSDRVLRSAAAGGDASGPDAVLGFQYAYYVERSGERARQFVAPDAAVPSAEIIQRGIGTVPVGTTHCVRVTTIGEKAAGESTYAVEVTEYRPGGAPATYNKQTVTTAVVGGRVLISSITAG